MELHKNCYLGSFERFDSERACVLALADARCVSAAQSVYSLCIVIKNISVMVRELFLVQNIKLRYKLKIITE